MADTTTQDIILRVGITGDQQITELKKKNTELLESVVKNQQALNDLQKANKDLQKAEGDHTKEIASNINSINELKNSNKLYQAEINNNMKLITAENNSLQEQRAQLSLLTAQYTNMKADDVASAAAKKALGDTINKLTTQLKEEEKAIGQTYREVGNYTDSIIKAMQQQGLGNTMMGKSVVLWNDFKEKAKKASEESHLLAVAQGKVAEGSSAASGGAAILNGAFKMLMANPIMLIIAAVAMIFFALKDAIGSSSKATNTLKEAMAPLQAIFKVVQDILAGVVTVVLEYFKAVTSIIGAIGSLIGITDKQSEAIKNSMIVEKERQELVKRGRELSVESAKTEMEVSELRSKSKEKDKYNADERKKMLGEAIVLEKTDMEKKKKLAEDELANLIKQQKVKGDLNTEDKNALADAQKKVYNMVTEFNMGTLRLKGQYQAAISEINAEAKKEEDKRLKEEKERQKEYEELQKKKLDLKRKAEDNLLSIIKDNQTREQEIMDAAYLRSLEDIKGNSKEEQALRKSIMDKYASDKEALENKYNQDRAQKEIELRIAAVEKGGKAELDLKIQQLEIQKNLELNAAKTLGIDKQLVIDKYNQLEKEAKNKHQEELNKKILDNEKLHHQNLLAELKLNNESTLKSELEDAIKRQSTLVKTNDETEEQFRAKKLQVANEIKDINAKILEDDLKRLEQYHQISEAIFKGLNSLGEIFASNQEDLATFQKTLGLFQIAISTGVAIAKGIEQSQSLPFPGNIAAMVSTVATVLANIATAKKTIDGSGNAPKAPKPKGYSTGGNVWGDGTGTSDSINARLSHGESVNNAISSAMFAPLYSILNQIGGGAPIQSINKSAEVYGEQFLANAFMKAAMSMPNPVVAVEDIRRGSSRVDVIESLAKQ